MTVSERADHIKLVSNLYHEIYKSIETVKTQAWPWAVTQKAKYPAGVACVNYGDRR